MREVDGRSARSAQAAALETRRVKDYDVPLGRLREEWRARAAEHGLDQEVLGRSIAIAIPSRRRSRGWRRGS